MKIAPPKGEAIFMAGVLGFEPRLKVLETLVLTIDTTPPQYHF